MRERVRARKMRDLTAGAGGCGNGVGCVWQALVVSMSKEGERVARYAKKGGQRES